jgi:ubiquinone/menaquinone biosynthesis C-methylase UbiE
LRRYSAITDTSRKVPDNSHQGHHHAGKSSKAYLNAERVLQETGLKSGDKFLDVGCGEGYFSIAAAKIVGNKGKVYAIDSYEKSIVVLKEQIQRENIGNIEAIVADVTQKMPLPKAIIDVCLMANVVHGFLANGELPSVMTEIARVMKVGSTLAVVEFQKIDGTPGPPISIRMTPEELEDLISGYGFAKNKVAEVGPLHYAAMFRTTPRHSG